MRNGALKSFADSKKLKYGTLNLIFISIVIVVAILLIFVAPNIFVNILKSAL